MLIIKSDLVQFDHEISKTKAFLICTGYRNVPYSINSIHIICTGQYFEHCYTLGFFWLVSWGCDIYNAILNTVRFSAFLAWVLYLPHYSKFGQAALPLAADWTQAPLPLAADWTPLQSGLDWVQQYYNKARASFV